MQIVEIDPILLKPHPDNAKLHTDKQIDRIAKSMKNTGGSVVPILVDEDNVILSGHGRWQAHKKRGDVLCPVIQKTGLTSAQKKKFLLADNQTAAMTGSDSEAVAAILLSLDGDNVDISDIGFSDKEIDTLLNYSEEEEERDELEEAGEESSGAFELSDSLHLEGFMCVGTYQLPPLLDNIPHIPDEFVVWMNRHRTPPLGQGQVHYHLFGRESTKGLDPANMLMSFYIDDVRFERVWTKLKENTQRFLNAEVWALTMPDFTRGGAMPLPEALWNTYRNFYCALYWQKAGLSVIPNITWWNDESVEHTCKPIPINAPTVSCQIQTMGGRTMKSGGQGADPEEFRRNLGVALDLLKPETLLVYGGDPGLTLGAEICKRHSVRFVGVANRATAATDINSERGF